MIRAARDESGLTLVEVLVTVMIMGIAFTVLLGGMGTSVLSSGLHEKQAKVEVEVRRFAELVKQRPYEASGTYAGAYTAPAGFSASMPTPAVCRNGQGHVAPCDEPKVVQLLTLSVASDGGDVTETVEVSKRS
ncbi:MAG TPA: prepilin-type N-terminal cleavage/methylation domain-containing protein [Acidimicrobiales bacterium]|nr:prepilin-type N-terminal cleavage/methylation domain-containing protein [Acidimicrobiales bacterium]